MRDIEREIQEMVDRETRAWDIQDVELLLSIFHPDMVWPWPPAPDAHDPLEWTLVLGRFDRARWRAIYEELFGSHRLVHNRRRTLRIVVSDEGDGAFAVVDVDTLWRSDRGGDAHWRGRACKIYSRVVGDWKLIGHTGLLDYPPRVEAMDGR